MNGARPRRLLALEGVWRNTYRDREAVEHIRDAQLRRLIRHAWAHVPYYRALFDLHGVGPEAVETAADLERLPTSTKRNIQESDRSEIVAGGHNHEALIVRRTSGSTGQPLAIRRTWIEERLLGAFRWRSLHALGLRASDRHAEIEEFQPLDPRDRQLAHRAAQAAGLYRQRRIDALREPVDILEELRRFAPDVLTGYAAVVARLARTAKPADLDAIRPRFVVVHSDTLTEPMRKAIGTAFRAPVYEMYDANECNVIAWQCRVTGALHTCDDSTIVEVLGENGAPSRPGERGEVVLTTLHSFAMPFIRYRIGDTVTQGDRRCACGAPFATIRAVEGRMFDYFPLADGRTIHPYEIIAVMRRIAPWVSDYQITQERTDRIMLRVVSAGTPSTGEIDRLDAEISRLLGPLVGFRVDLVPEITLDANAKLRVCRSLVSSEYDRDT